MNVITINNPSDVQLNGQSVGQVVDAQKNNPALASDIQTALATWWNSQQVSQQADIAALQAQITQLTADKDALQSQVSALTIKASALQPS